MGSPISIYDVVRVLGLEPKPGAFVAPDSRQASFKCPVCQHKGYTMSINFQKDTFVCPKCWSKGGATNLYSLVRHGTPYQKGTPAGNDLLKELREEIESKLSTASVSRMYIPKLPTIKPASDAVLDRVYSALLSLPRLKLSEKHRENLRKRGLNDAFIDAAQFRSMPPGCERTKNLSKRAKELLAKLPVRLTEDQLALGAVIVEELKSRGISDYTGVPGFFKIGGTWCLYTVPGIMIPTKNEKGQIVSIQIRKDEGELRYMTLSNKALPDHVQDNISRIHVVGNFDFRDEARRNETPFVVLITEGPLKADVIAHLWRKNQNWGLPGHVLILAIQGVNNTACLDPVLTWLKEIHVTTIYNCLDMDRIANKNVRKGSCDLRKKLNAQGFTFPALSWDNEAAQELKTRLTKRFPSFAFPAGRNSQFVQLAKFCELLEKEGIAHSKKGEYWPDRSKGLDDWLKYRSSLTAG